MSEKSLAPFPMKPYEFGALRIPQHTIPWYLGEYAWARYCDRTGTKPPIEWIARNGGFSVGSFLDLLAGGTGETPYAAMKRVIACTERSLLGQVELVTEGSKSYREAIREFTAEAEERRRTNGRMVFGSAGVYGNGQAVPRGEMWNGKQR